MRSAFRLCVVSLLCPVVGFGTGRAQREEGRKAWLLAPLQVNSCILLEETPEGCTIRVKPALTEGPNVVEIGPDYLAVEDLAGTVQTRIPIYAIRSVTVMRVNK